MSSRATVIEGAGAIAGVEAALPMTNHRGILTGLPGGDIYLRRDVEQGLISEHRLRELARIRAWKLGGYIRHRQAITLRLPDVPADTAGAVEELRRERARAAGVILPEPRRAIVENATRALGRIIHPKGPRSA